MYVKVYKNDNVSQMWGEVVLNMDSLTACHDNTVISVVTLIDCTFITVALLSRHQSIPLQTVLVQF